MTIRAPVPVRRARPTAAHGNGREQRPLLRLTFNAQPSQSPHQGVEPIGRILHCLPIKVDPEGALDLDQVAAVVCFRNDAVGSARSLTAAGHDQARRHVRVVPPGVGSAAARSRWPGRAPAIPACAGNADALGVRSGQVQDWVSGISKLTASSRTHWDHVAELLLKAAQTRKKSDIEAATAQMEHVLRRDNCL